MGLVMKEKMVLATPQGESQVQLLFGNITSLPLEEKVDTIFVSSFPGDYTTLPSTLIGALKRHLGIHVGKLAQAKELNLLHKFSCWVSKPLPDDMPFRRLVCFERKATQRIAEQISGIFRAMMPVFNNQDTSVITPLLATGNQGMSKEEVLKSTVTAACHWIMAGLPLRCLKIVVYVPNCHDIPEAYVKLITQFQQYKKKWEGKARKKKESTEEKKYDVCMSYAGGDMGLAQEVCRDLLKVDANMVIFKDRFIYDHNSVWQEQIFNVMTSARRIIAVLTPNYTEDMECLDQFNLALCCNRQSGCDVLVPFYLQTVSSFPSYMMLIQYTDCRVRKEGETNEEKIITACSLVVEGLGKDNLEQPVTRPKPGDGRALDEGASYDVFISYAHRTPKEAGLMYEALLEADPSLKIFLDRNELRMGNVWQEALYEAVDSARLVVAFLSHSYLQSTMCQEEFNIALARYLTQDGLYFIPVLIEDIADIPSSFTSTPIVDLRDPEKREDTKTYRKLADALIGYLHNGQHNQFSHPEDKLHLISVLDEWRRHLFHQRFEPDATDTIRLKGAPQPNQKGTGAATAPRTVAVSFTHDCLHQAATLTHLLKGQRGVKVTVEFLASKDPSGTQASKLLDSADMVVIFLSDQYMASVQHRTELHIALCRQRMVKERPIVYLIAAHHAKLLPMYPHLLPHSICLGDRHWFSLARGAHKLRQKESFNVLLPDGMEMRVYCTGQEYLGLLTAAIDVADKLVNGADGDSGIPTNIINLASADRLEQSGTEPIEKCLVPFSALSQRAERARGLGENTRMSEEAKRQLALLRELERDLQEVEMESSRQKRSSTCQLL